MLLLLGFAFLAGLFTALSPCIIPILPAILSAGVAQGKLRPLGTILGLICSFSFFTLTLSFIIHLTGISPQILRYIAILFIFFFGLVMLVPSLSSWFAKITTPIADLGQKIQGTKQREGFWGGAIFGVALGLLWTPCAGPILASITTLVATGAISAMAIFMTLAYSVGAGIPLFLLAYGSSKLIHASKFLSQRSETIRKFFGVLMILFAVLLASGWDMLVNEKLSVVFSENGVTTSKKEKLENQGPAPQLAGIVGWINSPPLTLSGLKGKVVLIDFWTYSCINCISTLPFVENWYETYKDKGFVVIGVHTPEFEFEKDYENVKKAVAHFGITYPVALDNNYETWNAYHNQYWPAHFLIDQEGNVRMVHIGEGDYVGTENGIRELLGLAPLATGEKAQKDRPISPETYLGLARGRSYQKDLIYNQTSSYTYNAPLQEDQVGIKGLWQAQDEYIMSKGDESYLDYNFLATHVYLVLSGSSQNPLEIFLDGNPYGEIKVDGDRKYDIVETSYGRHMLSLKVPKGIKAYAFTFGN